MQRATHADDPARLPAPPYGQQGHDPATLSAAILLENYPMTADLRLGPLPNTAVVKFTIAISEKLKADLDRYASLHSTRWAEPIDTARLIPHMLEAFIARDRGFKKASQP